MAGSFSAVSYAFNSSDSVVCVPFHEFKRQDIVSLEHENQSTVIGTSLICTSILFSLSGTFKFRPVDIFFHKSRISDEAGFMKNIDASSNKKLDDDILDCGVWISAQQTCINISCEEGKMEVLVDLSGIKFLLVRYEDHIGKSFDQLVLGNLLLQPHNCSHELSLSNCFFTLWLGHPHNALASCTASDTLGSSHSRCNVLHSMENSPITSPSEISTVWSRRFIEKLGFVPHTSTPAPSHWILLNIAFGEVFMTRCSIKNGLVGSHQVKKLLSSISVGGEFQTVSWAIQVDNILD